MAKKLVMVDVRGTRSTWGLETYATPEAIADWRADGLHVIVVENTIPEWVAELGLARLWCLLQDLFNFRNPWRKS